MRSNRLIPVKSKGEGRPTSGSGAISKGAGVYERLRRAVNRGTPATSTGVSRRSLQTA